ncbi:hypothetical protein F5Y08DRAFT_343390 [Xylaria arbuscula]|nr:hypothetical protein F5Y08DRAFT_343390 [Xylaria arbuscula]
METQSDDVQLDEQAELGKLTFDIFTLGKWDYARPVEQDQGQWNRLAGEWLGLDARGRHPYHGYDPDQTPQSQITATADQMSRVLVPHQTVCDRKLSVRTEMGRSSPVWLRTCYSPELASVYDKWSDSLELDSLLGDESQILEDETLYAPMAADWALILEDISEHYDQPGEGEEYKMPLYKAMIAEKTMLFLIDEEALRDQLIKVLWLHIHGTRVWRNRVTPSQMLAFKGQMFDGGCLASLYENFGDDPELYENGLVLDVN